MSERAEQVVDLRDSAPAGAEPIRTDVVAEPFLTPARAAAELGVVPRTVARWAEAGRIAAVRTPGGHRRYRASDVVDLRDVTRTG